MGIHSLQIQKKRKRPVEEKLEETFILHVEIICAAGLDGGDMDTEDEKRTYRVFVGVKDGTQFCTPEVVGRPNPQWKLIYSMEILDLEECEDLHVQVVKTRSREDPSTSTGNRVVGWAQIRLPCMVNVVAGGRITLAKPMEPEFVGAGYIVLYLKLKCPLTSLDTCSNMNIC